MKKYGASRYILTKEGEVLCNLTDFELVNPQDERWAQTEPAVDTREVEGKRLLIMGKKIPMDSPADYRLVLVADISQVYRDMEKQVMLFLEFYLAAAVISVLFIFLLTRRMLSPLRELQKAASDISEGVLNRRARVKMCIRDRGRSVCPYRGFRRPWRTFCGWEAPCRSFWIKKARRKRCPGAV